jgi:hypothetical protein
VANSIVLFEYTQPELVRQDTHRMTCLLPLARRCLELVVDALLQNLPFAQHWKIHPIEASSIRVRNTTDLQLCNVKCSTLRIRCGKISWNTYRKKQVSNCGTWVGSSCDSCLAMPRGVGPAALSKAIDGMVCPEASQSLNENALIPMGN